MKFAHILGVAALAGATLLAPAPASAQIAIESLGVTVTTTPALVSDYLFRGISQTRGSPAVQGTIDIEHSSGVYIGGFISNVAWPSVTPQVDIRQEVDFTFGYRFELAGVKFDVGGTYFGYPGYNKPAGSFDWAWWEANLRANYQINDTVKVLGTVAWSPNFNYESGNAWYVEGGVDLSLAYDITASLRAGYQTVQYNTQAPRNHGAWGAPDYGVFSVGFAREIAFGVIGNVTLTHTTLRDRTVDCFGGLSICGTRLTGGLSRPF
jgi:uncharacterized protein (TIGR02001 family)